MVDQNKKPQSDDEIDVDHLREVVLSWVEEKEKKDKESKKRKNKVKKIAPSKKKVAAKEASPTTVKKDKPAEITKLIPPKKISPASLLPSPLKKTSIKLLPSGEKKSVKVIIISILLLVAIVLISIGAWLNITKPLNSASRNITKVLPYPIAFVGFQPLYYSDWQLQMESLLQFYAQESAINPQLPVPSRNQTEKHILDRMIDRALINQAASYYNLEVTQLEIDNQIASLVQEIGSKEALDAQLESLYGWTQEEFEREIVIPLLKREKVSMAITLDDRFNQEARLQAEEILKKLKSGADFNETATQYSQDVTSIQGGDLGYFGKGQMVPEFEQAAFNLEVKEISNIVKTSFGYHIIKVEERLENDEGEVVQIRARHILVRGENINSYLEKKREELLIVTFLKI